MDNERAEPIRVELERGLLEDVERISAHAYPNETGGILLGAWLSSSLAVLTSIVGSGPKAVGKKYSYEADVAYEREQIARIYEDSGRRETYLGDWHSHPGAQSGLLSRADINVMQRISETPSARCPSPLMAVVWGRPEAWQLTVWFGSRTSRSWFRRPFAVVLSEHSIRLDPNDFAATKATMNST